MLFSHPTKENSQKYVPRKLPDGNGEDDDDLSAFTAIAFRILADDRKKVTFSKSLPNRPKAGRFWGGACSPPKLKPLVTALTLAPGGPEERNRRFAQ